MKLSRAVILFMSALPAILLLVGPSTPHAAPRTEFCVATNGDDRNPGSIARPFATLERARDAIRGLKQNGLPSGGVTVLIRGGSYHLDKAFELNDQDSGSPGAPIAYRPYQNEEVHLTGGRPLSGFSPVADPAVLARLAPEARGKVVQVDLRARGIVDFGELKPRGFGAYGIPSALQLYFQGRPMTLARWPNRGWINVAGIPAGPKGRRFAYLGNRPGRWQQLDDIWLHGYWAWDWADSYLKVAAIDSLSCEIVTQAPPAFGFKAGSRYYALNILEELDEPGEWYLDRNSGILYFWPPAPVPPGTAYVSLLPTIVSLQDVSDLTIQGITIEYCRGTAVLVHGGRNNRIAGCVIRNTGNAAVEIKGGTNNGVQGCDIQHCGESGIILAGGERRTLTAGGNYADNNRIHDFGQWVRSYTPGIDIRGVANRVAHNLIYQAPHSAILLFGNEHLIEYNEIHHVCLETSDAGAFYMGKDYSERGNVVRYNYFHHLNLGDVQAIYLDDFASGTTVYGNVVYRAGRGVDVGGGRDNTVKNNIFIDCLKPNSLDARGTSWSRKYFDGTDTTLTDRLRDVNYRQPPYSTRYPELLTLYDRNPALPEGNAFVNNISVGTPLLVLEDGLTGKTVKIEGNLDNKDPGFVDRAHGNFQLKPGSPAFRLGFRRIPMELIGLRRDEFRK